ncbi:hypothetical protein Scep_006812 [Stephania cephalantha]|uniref:Uncharacterized protein n=1 Tax=Stephania cephalantha TaxID=152367 RepID=A0AAP0K9W4_9MAGN
MEDVHLLCKHERGASNLGTMKDARRLNPGLFAGKTCKTKPLEVGLRGKHSNA